MSSFYKLQIKEVKHETANAISVAFAIPEGPVAVGLC